MKIFRRLSCKQGPSLPPTTNANVKDGFEWAAPHLLSFSRNATKYFMQPNVPTIYLPQSKLPREPTSNIWIVTLHMQCHIPRQYGMLTSVPRFMTCKWSNIMHGNISDSDKRQICTSSKKDNHGNALTWWAMCHRFLGEHISLLPLFLLSLRQPATHLTPASSNMFYNTKHYGSSTILSAGKNSAKLWQKSRMPKHLTSPGSHRRHSKPCPLSICDMSTNMSMTSSLVMRFMSNVCMKYWSQCVPVLKSGDLSDPNNWRGVMLMDICIKIFSSVMNGRAFKLLNKHCTSWDRFTNSKSNFSRVGTQPNLTLQS